MEQKDTQKKMPFSKRLVLYSILLFVVFVTVFAVSLFTDTDATQEDHFQIGIDFADYYTAGHMAISGELAHVYDVSSHRDAMAQLLGISVPFTLPWRYPPVFLMAIVPFALLPFRVSLIAWLVITLALAALAVYRMLPNRKWLAALLFGFPGVFMNLRWGQNGFLSAALLAAGVGALENNPLLGGAMLGLLIFKPQFAVLPFLLLLLTKRWKALGSAIGSAVVASLVSIALFGVNQWVEFFRSLFVSSSNLLEVERASIAAIQLSPYNALINLGVSSPVSWVIQGILSVAAVAVVYWIFTKTNRAFLRGAALVLGIPLVIPYFMQYDLMILAVPIILLAYEFLEKGASKIEFALLELLFLLPILNWPLVIYTRVQVCPLVMIATMILILLRVKRERSQPSVIVQPTDLNPNNHSI